MAPLGALLCMAAFLLALWIQVQTHGFLTSLVDEFPDAFEDPLHRADPEKVHALVHYASWMTVLVHGVFCLGTGMVAAGLPERDSAPPRAYGGWVAAAVFCLVPWTVLMVCSVGSFSWDFPWPLADAGGFEIPLLTVAICLVSTACVRRSRRPREAWLLAVELVLMVFLGPLWCLSALLVLEDLGHDVFPKALLLLALGLALAAPALVAAVLGRVLGVEPETVEEEAGEGRRPRIGLLEAAVFLAVGALVAGAVAAVVITGRQAYGVFSPETPAAASAPSPDPSGGSSTPTPPADLPRCDPSSLTLTVREIGAGWGGQTATVEAVHRGGRACALAGVPQLRMLRNGVEVRHRSHPLEDPMFPGEREPAGVAVAPGGRAQFLVWWPEEQKTPAVRPQLQMLLGRGSAPVPVGYSQDLQPGTGFTVREGQDLDVGYWYTP